MIEFYENILDLGGSDKFYQLYRINYNGLRLYIRREPFAYFSGLTGAMDKATFKGDPESKVLTRWREQFISTYSKKDVDDYVSATADFGTLIHEALVTIKENGEINWAEQKDRAQECFADVFRSQGRDPDGKVIRSMVFEVNKQVASLLQFCHERVQTIEAIEVPAIWLDLKIATPIDLVCTARQTPKGDFHRHTINIKTSSSIGQKQLDQASCENVMWNETYPEEYEAHCTGILRTKDWKIGKTPTYEFKSLDKGEILDRSADWFNRLSLCLQGKATYYPEPSSSYFEGVTKIGEVPKVKIVSLEEEWGDYWNEIQEEAK